MTTTDELTRYTMSLPTADYEALGELAALLGVSRASLVRDLLAAARPVWSVLLDAARTIAAAPQAQRAAMALMAAEMGSQLRTATAAVADLTEALGDLDGPPASNTGVTTP